jgi:hypothetical protein
MRIHGPSAANATPVQVDKVAREVGLASTCDEQVPQQAGWRPR